MEEDKKMNHDSQKDFGCSPLHWLCGFNENKNMIALISSLYGRVVNFNAVNSERRSPLQELCKKHEGNDLKKVVQFFIDNGTDFNIADSKERTAFLEVCCCNYVYNLVEVIQLLMKFGVPEDGPFGSQGKNTINISLQINIKTFRFIIL